MKPTAAKVPAKAIKPRAPNEVSGVSKPKNVSVDRANIAKPAAATTAFSVLLLSTLLTISISRRLLYLWLLPTLLLKLTVYLLRTGHHTNGSLAF